MRILRDSLFLLLPATLLCSCWHMKSADQIAKNGGLYNKFVPAAQTTIVGKVEAVNLYEAYAIIERDPSRKAFSTGAFLVVRDADHNPTAVLQTTKHVGRVAPSQGVMIVSGQPKEGDEVLEPGPELARLVQENIDKYLVDHSAPAATEAPAMMNTPAPAAAAPATTTAPSPEIPAPAATTPTMDNPMPATPPAM